MINLDTAVVPECSVPVTIAYSPDTSRKFSRAFRHSSVVFFGDSPIPCIFEVFQYAFTFDLLFVMGCFTSSRFEAAVFFILFEIC